ncbi:MAG: polyprenyl synthetase family protein [Gammaproteobacteria bacterium]|nr:polyprenyl synthetase family protein [Gammaproteobacteria bacterium]
MEKTCFNPLHPLPPHLQKTTNVLSQNFLAFVAQHQRRIEQVLERHLPSIAEEPSRLHQAMRYVTLNGGKRIRPLLIYATGHMLEGKPEILDSVACAVELVHSYSLVHDDLPSMDNDDLRRGKPSCHKAFDEATAILVGDALHALAFEVLTQMPLEQNNHAKILRDFASAIGSLGMVGGQSMDLGVMGREVSVPELEILYHKKTGALFEASILLAAEVSGCRIEKHYALLRKYAECLGLAFQIQDDVLDIEGKTENLGKAQGKDKARGKMTYPSLIGLVAAKQTVARLYAEANQVLLQLPYSTEYLAKLMEYLGFRNH